MDIPIDPDEADAIDIHHVVTNRPDGRDSNHHDLLSVRRVVVDTIHNLEAENRVANVAVLYRGKHDKDVAVPDVV